MSKTLYPGADGDKSCEINKKLLEFHERAQGIAAFAVVTRAELVALLSQAAISPQSMDRESLHLLEAVLEMLGNWSPGGLCLACDHAPSSLASVGAFVVVTAEAAGGQAICSALCEKCSRKRELHKVVCGALRRHMWPNLRELTVSEQPGHV